MTPAVDQVKKQKVTFELHQYEHDASANSFGLEAVNKLNVAANRVYKTLIVSSLVNNKEQLAVAIVPVEYQLNLKSMAKALQTKKVTMADAKRVEASTGYVLGGVSPLGQKKRLKTIIDQKSQSFSTIFISGGKRGLEIELSANDLSKMTNAKFFELTTDL
ncbi:MAG: Cys-tRNA(Pro) deacylase [Colwellia sp.]|nr:Cys-tRNA(Pro) deacylase [Colwellia sp.]